MNTPLPNGLSPRVSAAVVPLRDELVRAGWVFGGIHWDGEIERKLAFSAKSPRGLLVYIACEETALAGKLRELLDAVEPNPESR